MMTNLFSMFDPTTSFMSLSWSLGLMLMLFLPSVTYSGGTCFLFFVSFMGAVKAELDYVLKSKSLGDYLFIGSIFLVLCLFNFSALFPFIFSLTSHVAITLPLAYSFWSGVIIFSWVKSLSSFLAHLIPNGTPLALMSFMVLVELLSNMIRPLALTFRLTANMMAGHLLMSLIGGFLISLSFSSLLVGSLVQSLLVIMELGVSIIQAYVFSTLLLLYISEGSS